MLQAFNVNIANFCVIIKILNWVNFWLNYFSVNMSDCELKCTKSDLVLNKGKHSIYLCNVNVDNTEYKD